MNTSQQRVVILTLLGVALAATRIHHFAAVPDATWAVFFVGGFYLSQWTRWAFPALMALAVLVDFIVINGQGLNFFTHYCMSPGYWALVPAYFAMWGGGWWLQRHHGGIGWKALGLLAVTLPVVVVLCHLFAQGGFYWTSDSVANPTFAGWWKNYTDWLAPYLRVAVMYVAVAAMAHVSLVQLGVLKDAGARQRAS